MNPIEKFAADLNQDSLPISSSQNTLSTSTQGAKYSSDPMINAIIQQESAGNPLAKSKAGAVGVMQLMKDTAISLGLIVDDTKDERLDPVKNVEAGTRYFYSLLKDYNNDYSLALMAYNWGPGNVNNWIS